MFNFGRLSSGKTRPDSEASSRSGKKKNNDDDDDESVRPRKESWRQSTPTTTLKRKSSLKASSHRSSSRTNSTSRLDNADDTPSRTTTSRTSGRDQSQYRSTVSNAIGDGQHHAGISGESTATGRQERRHAHDVREANRRYSKGTQSDKAGHDRHSRGSASRPSEDSDEHARHHSRSSSASMDNGSTSLTLDQHTAALPQNQFFSDPSSYTRPYRPPPNGHAAEYYNDNGESVQHQPGVRPNRPSYVVNQEYAHLQTPSLESRPPPEPSSIGQVGAAASFFAMHNGDEGTTPSRDRKSSRPRRDEAAGSPRGASGTKVSHQRGTKPGEDAHSSNPTFVHDRFRDRVQSGSDAVPATSRGASSGEAASYFNAASTSVDATPSDWMSSLPSNQHPPFPSQSGSMPYNQNSRPVYATNYPQGGIEHRHKGPISRLAEWWNDPTGVRQFEEYTEYIGVCKYCFDPNASTKGPRKHYRNLRRRDSRYGDNMRVDKRYRQDSSDEERRRRTGVNTKTVGAGLAGLGAARLGEQWFKSGHDVNDTYSAKPERPSDGTSVNVSTQYHRHGSQEDLQARRVNSHGKADRRHQQQTPNRRVRRKSSSSQEDTVSRGSAMSVAAGVVGLALAAEAAHRRRSRSPERPSTTKAHYSKRISPRHSYVDLNDTVAPATSGIASFFTSPSANRRKGKSSKGFFTLGNGSSSSSDADLAFGEATIRRKQSSSPGKGHGKRRNARETGTDTAAILGLATAGTALAAEASRRGTMVKRDRYADRDADLLTSRYQRTRIDLHDHDNTNDENGDVWEDASDDESVLSIDAGLAYGGNLTGGPSRESLSSDPGTSKWDWRWNKRKVKQEDTKLRQRQSLDRDGQPGLHEYTQTPHTLLNNADGMNVGAVFDHAQMTTEPQVQSRRLPPSIATVPLSQVTPPTPRDHTGVEQTFKRNIKTEQSSDSLSPPTAKNSAGIAELLSAKLSAVNRNSVTFDLTAEQIENEQRAVERQRRRPERRLEFGGFQAADVEQSQGASPKQDILNEREKEIDAQIAALEAKRASKKRQMAQQKTGSTTTGTEYPRRSIVEGDINAARQKPSDSAFSIQRHYDVYSNERSDDHRRKELEQRQDLEARRLREQEVREAAERTRMREIHRSQSDTSGIATTAMLAAAAAAAAAASRAGEDRTSLADNKRASGLKNESFADGPGRARDQPEQSSRRNVARIASTSPSRSRSPVHEDYSKFFTPEDIREHVQEHNNKARQTNTQLVIVDVVPEASTNALLRKAPFDPEVYQKFGLGDDHDPLRHPWKVPLLDLIEPTPPSSHFGSTKDPSSPLVLAEKHDADIPIVEVVSVQHTESDPKVRWGQHDTFVYDVLTPEYEHRDPAEELLNRLARSDMTDEAAFVPMDGVSIGLQDVTLRSGRSTEDPFSHEKEADEVVQEPRRPKPERVFTLEDDAEEEAFMHGVEASISDVDQKAHEDHVSTHIPGAFDDEDLVAVTQDVPSRGASSVDSNHEFYQSPFAQTISDVDILRTRPDPSRVHNVPDYSAEDKGIDAVTDGRALSPVLGPLFKNRSARVLEDEAQTTIPASESQRPTGSRPTRSDRRRSERSSVLDVVVSPSADPVDTVPVSLQNARPTESGTGTKPYTDGRERLPKPSEATRDVMRSAAVAAAAAAAALATLDGAQLKSSRTRSHSSASVLDMTVTQPAVHKGRDGCADSRSIAAETSTARHAFSVSPHSEPDFYADKSGKVDQQELEREVEISDDFKSSVSLNRGRVEDDWSRSQAESHYLRDSEEEKQSIVSTNTVRNGDHRSKLGSKHESLASEDVLSDEPSSALAATEELELADPDDKTADDSRSNRSSSGKQNRRIKRRGSEDNDDDLRSVQSSSRRRERKVNDDSSSKPEKKSSGFFSTLFSSSKSDSVKSGPKSARKSESNMSHRDDDQGGKKLKKRRSKSAQSVADLSQTLENDDESVDGPDRRDIKSELSAKDSTDDDSTAAKDQQRSFLAERPEMPSSIITKHESVGTDGVSGPERETEVEADAGEDPARTVPVEPSIAGPGQEYTRSTHPPGLPNSPRAKSRVKDEHVSPVSDALAFYHQEAAQNVSLATEGRTALVGEADAEGPEHSVYSTPFDERRDVFEELHTTDEFDETPTTSKEAEVSKSASVHSEISLTDDDEPAGHSKPALVRPRALSIVQPSAPGSSVTSPSTMVPLFARRFPVTPQGTTREVNSSPIPSPISPLSTHKTRQARPKSTEFSSKEFRPLYLVERHTPAKLERVSSSELLPSLPSSRTSSVRGSSEDLRGLASDDSAINEQQPASQSERGRRHSWQSDTRPTDDFLDSRSATPTPHDRKRPVEYPRERRELPKEWFHSPSELLQDPAFHAEVNLEDVDNARASSPLPSVVSTDIGDESFMSAGSRASTPETERWIQRPLSSQDSSAASLPERPAVSHSENSSRHTPSNSISGWAAAIAAGAAAVGSGIGAVITGSGSKSREPPGSTSEEHKPAGTSTIVTKNDAHRPNATPGKTVHEETSSKSKVVKVEPKDSLARAHMDKDPSLTEDVASRQRTDDGTSTQRSSKTDSSPESPPSTEDGILHAPTYHDKERSELEQSQSTQIHAKEQSSDELDTALRSANARVGGSSKRAVTDPVLASTTKGAEASNDAVKSVTDASKRDGNMSDHQAGPDASAVIQRGSPPTLGSVSFEDYYRLHRPAQVVSPESHHQQMYALHPSQHDDNQLVAMLPSDESSSMLPHPQLPQAYAESLDQEHSHPSPQFSHSQSASPYHSFVQPAPLQYVAPSIHDPFHSTHSDHHPSPRQIVIIPVPTEHGTPAHGSVQTVPVFSEISPPLSSHPQSIQQVADASTPWSPRRASKAEEDAAEEWYRSSFASSVLPGPKTAEGNSFNDIVQHNKPPFTNDEITRELVDTLGKEEIDISMHDQLIDDTAAKVPLPEPSADELGLLSDENPPVVEKKQGTNSVDDVGAAYVTSKSNWSAPAQPDERSISLQQDDEEDNWSLAVKKSKKDKKSKKGLKSKATGNEDVISSELPDDRSESAAVLARGALAATAASLALREDKPDSTEDKITPVIADTTARSKKESRKDKKKSKRDSVLIDNYSRPSSDVEATKDRGYDDNGDRDTKPINIETTSEGDGNHQRQIEDGLVVASARDALLPQQDDVQATSRPTGDTAGGAFGHGSKELDHATDSQNLRAAEYTTPFAEDSTAASDGAAQHEVGQSEPSRDTDSMATTTRDIIEDAKSILPVEADDTEWATTGKNSKKSKKKKNKRLSTTKDPQAVVLAQDDEDVKSPVESPAPVNTQSAVPGEIHPSTINRGASPSRLTVEPGTGTINSPAFSPSDTTKRLGGTASQDKDDNPVLSMNELLARESENDGAIAESPISTQIDKSGGDAGIQEVDEEFAWVPSSKKSKKGKKKKSQLAVNLLQETEDVTTLSDSIPRHSEEVEPNNGTTDGRSEQQKVDEDNPVAPDLLQEEEYGRPSTSKKTRQDNKKKKRFVFEDSEDLKGVSTSLEGASLGVNDQVVTADPDEQPTDRQPLEPGNDNDTLVEGTEWTEPALKKKKKDKKKRSLIVEDVEADAGPTPSDAESSAVEARISDLDRSIKLGSGAVEDESNTIDDSKKSSKAKDNEPVVKQLEKLDRPPVPSVLSAPGEDESNQIEPEVDTDTPPAVTGTSSASDHNETPSAQQAGFVRLHEESRASQAHPLGHDGHEPPNTIESELPRVSTETSTRPVVQELKPEDYQDVSPSSVRSPGHSSHASFQETSAPTLPETIGQVTTPSPAISAASAPDTAEAKAPKAAGVLNSGTVTDHEISLIVTQDTKSREAADPLTNRPQQTEEKEDDVTAENQFWAPFVKKSKKDKKKKQSKGEVLDEPEEGSADPIVLDQQQEESNQKTAAPANDMVDVEEEWGVPSKKAKKDKKQKKKGKSKAVAEDDSEAGVADENIALDTASLAQADPTAAADTVANDKHEVEKSTGLQSGAPESIVEDLGVVAPVSFDLEAGDDEWATSTKKSKKDKKKKKGSKLGSSTSGTQTPTIEKDISPQQPCATDDTVTESIAGRRDVQDNQGDHPTTSTAGQVAEDHPMTSPDSRREELAPANALIGESDGTKTARNQILSSLQQEDRPELIQHEESDMTTQAVDTESVPVNENLGVEPDEAGSDDGNKADVKRGSSTAHEHTDRDTEETPHSSVSESVANNQNSASIQNSTVSVASAVEHPRIEKSDRVLQHEDRGRDELDIENLAIPGSFFVSGEESNEAQNGAEPVLEGNDGSTRNDNEETEPEAVSSNGRAESSAAPGPEASSDPIHHDTLQGQTQDKPAVPVSHSTTAQDTVNERQVSATTDDLSKPHESPPLAQEDGSKTTQLTPTDLSREPGSATGVDRTAVDYSIDGGLPTTPPEKSPVFSNFEDLTQESSVVVSENEWAPVTRKTKKDKKGKKNKAALESSKLEPSMLVSMSETQLDSVPFPPTRERHVVVAESTSMENAPSAYLSLDDTMVSAPITVAPQTESIVNRDPHKQATDSQQPMRVGAIVPLSRTVDLVQPNDSADVPLLDTIQPGVAKNTETTNLDVPMEVALSDEANRTGTSGEQTVSDTHARRAEEPIDADSFWTLPTKTNKWDKKKKQKKADTSDGDLDQPGDEAREAETTDRRNVPLKAVEEADDWSFSSKQSKKDKKKKKQSLFTEHDSSTEASTPRSVDASTVKPMDDQPTAAAETAHVDSATKRSGEVTTTKEGQPDVANTEKSIESLEVHSSQPSVNKLDKDDSQVSAAEPGHESSETDFARDIVTSAQHIEPPRAQSDHKSDYSMPEKAQATFDHEDVADHEDNPDHADTAITAMTLPAAIAAPLVAKSLAVNEPEPATEENWWSTARQPGNPKKKTMQSASDDTGDSSAAAKDEIMTQDAAEAVTTAASKEGPSTVSGGDVPGAEVVPESKPEDDSWLSSTKKSKKDRKSKKKAKAEYLDIDTPTTLDESTPISQETFVAGHKGGSEQNSRSTETVDAVSAERNGNVQHEDTSTTLSSKPSKRDKPSVDNAGQIVNDKEADILPIEQDADPKHDEPMDNSQVWGSAVTTDPARTTEVQAEDEWVKPSKKSKKDQKKRKSTNMDGPIRPQSPERPAGGSASIMPDTSAKVEQEDLAIRATDRQPVVAGTSDERDQSRQVKDFQIRGLDSEQAPAETDFETLQSSRQVDTARDGKSRNGDTADDAPAPSESAQPEETEEWTIPVKRSKKDKKKRKSAARVESSYDATPQESSTDIAISDRSSRRDMARAPSALHDTVRHEPESAISAMQPAGTAEPASVRGEAPPATAEGESIVEPLKDNTRDGEDSDGSQISETTRERRRRRRSPRLQANHDPDDLPGLAKDRTITPPPDHDDMMDTALSIAAGLGLGAAAMTIPSSHHDSGAIKEAAAEEESTSWSFARSSQPQNSHRDSAMQMDDSPTEYQTEFRQNRDSGYVASPQLESREGTQPTGPYKRYSHDSSRQARSRSPTSSAEDVTEQRSSHRQVSAIESVSRGMSPNLPRSSSVIATIPVELVHSATTSPIERPRSGLRSHRDSHGDLRAQARSPLSQRGSPITRRESGTYGTLRSPQTPEGDELSASLLHRVRTAEIDRSAFNLSPRLESQFSPRQSIERPFSPKSPLETINEDGLALGAVAALGLVGGAASMSRGRGDGSLGVSNLRSVSLQQQPPRLDIHGAARSVSMSDALEGVGVGAGAGTSSPSIRPPSLRSRKSLTQINDLQTRVEQLASENKQLAESKQLAERHIEELQFEHSKNDYATREALQTVNEQLRLRDDEITRLRVEIQNLQSAREALRDEHDQKYTLLLNEKDRAHAQLQEHTRELDMLSTGMQDTVAAQIAAAVASKDSQLQKLQDELAQARAKIRELQSQIVARGFDQVVELRDEDYFDAACQALSQHVQQWVLRFSKFSDNRVCRTTAEVQDEKVVDRFDNAILDGTDVDLYLADRTKRRDVFMSVVMTMIWEYVFTRYLFGMDRDQRQKLKQLEKNLAEVGPPSAVHQWRALTLTLLAKRAQFKQQKESDTEAVAIEIVQTLAKFLPPPQNLEPQIYESLRNVMRAAVKLSIEMRTQKAEYIMLPPLQPQYDTNGDLVQKVYFNAALMNERSGETSSNDELEQHQAIVRMVLFPLVVKKTDDRGEGEEEVVVYPAQVLIARPDKGKRRSTRTLAEGDRAQSRMSQSAMLSSHSLGGV